MRKTTPFANSDDLVQLDRLANKKTQPTEYRAALKALGVSLGNQVARKLGTKTVENVCLACTVEDADSLAQGMLDAFNESGLADKVRLTCYWNTRLELPGISLAPIIKEYAEPCDIGRSVVVVAKSIIASGCVVRTNLSKLITNANPKHIFIVSPVMLKGADKALQSEFSHEIARKFEYITLAVDSDRDEHGMVVPGVGGDIYTRLGYGGASQKNDVLPDLVKTRRQQRIRSVPVAQKRQSTRSAYIEVRTSAKITNATIRKKFSMAPHCFHKCA